MTLISSNPDAFDSAIVISTSLLTFMPDSLPILAGSFMEGNNPRQHHVVPAFYLGGFTDIGRVDGKLHVFDYTRNKHYRCSPHQVGRERDYYRIYELEADPYVMERSMADLEGVIAPVLRDVSEARRVTNTGQVGDLLTLAAMISARDQRGRIQISRGLAAGLREKLAAGKVTKQQWDQLRGAELRAGVDPSELPEYERAIELVNQGEWTPRAPQVLQVGLIPTAAHAIRERLVARSWELSIADSSTNGGFICSNSPLVWGSLDQIQDGNLNASLDDPEVEITFPVNKTCALVSHPGARRGNLPATDEVVAHVNMRTLQLSMGLVFHGEPDFLLRRAGEQIAWGSSYFAYVDQARKKGVERP